MKSYIEPEEVTIMEQAASNLRDKIMVRVLFHLGCRVSEALSIAVEDIDLAKDLITIQHLKVRLNLSCPCCHAQLGRSHSFCPKCGTKVQDAVAQEKEHRRVRTLPVDPVTMAMLKDYISRGGPVSKNGKLLIFGINRHRAWQIIRDCANKAGLPKLINPETGRVHGVSPHKLRDSFAVHAMKLNDSDDGMRLLQEHLGHASFNTTAKYRKISGEEHQEWYRQLWQKDENPGLFPSVLKNNE